MFEGLFQPMHLLVIFFHCAAGVRSQEAPRTRQGSRRRNSCPERWYEERRHHPGFSRSDQEDRNQELTTSSSRAVMGR